MLNASPDTFTNMHPLPCSPEQFSEVKRHVLNMALDNRDMHPGEFLTIGDEKGLQAFCRARNHGKFSELCSLGVIGEARGKGYATSLVEAVFTRCGHPVYLVTVIPTFFAALGFEICHDHPEQIGEKLRYCREDLPVEDCYVVMLRKPLA